MTRAEKRKSAVCRRIFHALFFLTVHGHDDFFFQAADGIRDCTSTLGVSRNRRGLATGPGTDLEWKKANGIHYTPFQLAKYLAEQVASGLKAAHAKADQISILDPACGEGELLKAIVDAVPHTWKAHLHLTGFDMDEAALV